MPQDNLQRCPYTLGLPGQAGWYLVVPFMLARAAGSLAPQLLSTRAGSALLFCLSSLQKGVSMSVQRRFKVQGSQQGNGRPRADA